jgi:hypothetical protein
VYIDNLKARRGLVFERSWVVEASLGNPVLVIIGFEADLKQYLLDRTQSSDLCVWSSDDPQPRVVVDVPGKTIGFALKSDDLDDKAVGRKKLLVCVKNSAELTSLVHGFFTLV